MVKKNTVKQNTKNIEEQTMPEGRQASKVESLVIFKCNCNCLMCSTGLQIKRNIGSADYHAVRPFEDVKKDIDRVKEMKAAGFAFSGGEPNLRRDLPELAAYAKKIGLSHIEVQSNGRVYAYKEYCRKLIDSGVNNFVVSFHSHKPELADKIMGVPGTFKQAFQGIKNLNELGHKVKINIVMLELNYKQLEEHVKFLLKNFKIQEIRFTMVMLEGNAIDNTDIVAPMSKVAPYLCRAIDIVNNLTARRVQSFIYNMVPCLVPGHEIYINDLGPLGTLLIGPEFEAMLDESMKGKKIKAPVCQQCKYNSACHGVWRSYAELFGLTELKPVK
ncbi:MAG: radical SAM protein [Candidatus Portnoybacteria bacterium]|nr:radical SAM protein [Candidatus Portnoybacteria bacterium]MDD4982866.1 radical SAM protein [Candidatus Portnoybacteria bacterium]